MLLWARFGGELLCFLVLHLWLGFVRKLNEAIDIGITDLIVL